ncbi:hypothetical protein F4677DRAFT_186798 [Hypoxylon crocopeplum]|nr:hypothetical protein F4677DRAFT_186798 [Hypoxylon crocopeplum]
MTCLSAEDHGHNIKDPLQHYLGCLEINDRPGFFEDSNPLWKDIIDEHTKLGSKREEVEETVAKKKNEWKTNCLSELRRIGFLRKTLRGDIYDKHLVERIEESSTAWRESEEYRNIVEVTKWRSEKRRKPYVNVTERLSIIHDDKYEPEKDVSVPLIQFENGKGVNEDDPRVWNTFPNQKTTVSKLIDDEDPDNNLLYRHRHDSSDRIRYFHIHANNMIWAEEAIYRYFGEKRPDFNTTHHEFMRPKTRASMVLQPKLWRSQIHGDQRAYHTQHMRPLCAVVSSEPESTPGNIVLFMPYLHWETSRQREQFATEVERIMAIAKDRAYRDEKVGKEMRQAERRRISRSPTCSKKPGPPPIPRLKWLAYLTKMLGRDTLKRLGLAQQEQLQFSKNCTRTETWSMDMLADKVELTKTQRNLEVDMNGRVKIKSRLGQYLLDAARLYEGITNYRDKSLLRKYLRCDLPLHPRRTLDQAYYWTLKSTRTRDRDQVIYRATTAKPEDFHQYDYNDQNGGWKEHKDFEITGECNDCRVNIRKLSRVIMVDQLWMWILDKKTIITCFPKRYGTNKQDASGIHKSIRLRLEDNVSEQIRSVFDVALMIMDECSNPFFDRTKTSDLQPQLIDEFSNAIGNIMHQQSAAFERLWHWTSAASDVYRARGYVDASELHVPLLDINPEGKLEREIKDIVEELDIMIYITKTYEDILKNFVANVEDFLDPSGEWRKANRNFWRRNCRRPKDRDHFGPRERNMDNGERMRPEEGMRPEDTMRPEGRIRFEDRMRPEDDEGLHVYSCFKLNAEDRLLDARSRVEKLQELRTTACSTAENVKALLDLKQQQASVVQAWQAVKQSNESVKQGRSIMMFTVVTIVFLPLSFMSSVFGMNNIQISGDSWQISDEFKYMFPISAGVIFISLVLAFATWIRALIWYVFKIPFTYLTVHTGLYSFWLGVGLPSDKIYQRGTKWVDGKENDVRKARFKYQRERRELQDAMKRKKEELELLRERSTLNGSAALPHGSNNTSGSVVPGDLV